jgi:hypothetical protein
MGIAFSIKATSYVFVALEVNKHYTLPSKKL